MKQFRQQHKQQNRPKRSALLVGVTEVSNAIKSGKFLDKILINSKVSEKTFSDVIQLANKNAIPFQKVPPEKIAGLNVGEMTVV